MATPDEYTLEPAGFVPLSLEEEIIAALVVGDAPTAAEGLRHINSAGRLLLDALASMFDDDRSRLQKGPRIPNVRLVFRAWGRGRPVRSGGSPAASADEKILSALAGENAPAVAGLLRQTDSVGQLILGALADMLDGDVSNYPELKLRYPRRLKIVTAASAGRPRRGDKRWLTAKSERPRKLGQKTKGWEVMMAGRVKRALARGATRMEAIEEARMAQPFHEHSGQRLIPPSYEAVEKAFDKSYRKSRRETAKRGPPAKE